MNTLHANGIMRAMQARNRRAAAAAQRRSVLRLSIIPLYRSPIARLAWIFGLAR